MHSLIKSVVLLVAFFIGAVLMGLEMLGSRYLFPYFGGGTGTWAALISTVLVALTFGYMAGGWTVDIFPTSRILAINVLIAAIYLAGLPRLADRTMITLLDTMGNGPGAILVAAAAILLVPLSLLGTLSPFCIRLLTKSANESGRVSGQVYGVSTIGNVFGTLFTTFYLIPKIGSRAITYWFSLALVACSIILAVLPNPRSNS